MERVVFSRLCSLENFLKVAYECGMAIIFATENFEICFPYVWRVLIIQYATSDMIAYVIT